MASLHQCSILHVAGNIHQCSLPSLSLIIYIRAAVSFKLFRSFFALLSLPSRGGPEVKAMKAASAKTGSKVEQHALLQKWLIDSEDQPTLGAIAKRPASASSSRTLVVLKRLGAGGDGPAAKRAAGVTKHRNKNDPYTRQLASFPAHIQDMYSKASCSSRTFIVNALMAEDDAGRSCIPNLNQPLFTDRYLMN